MIFTSILKDFYEDNKLQILFYFLLVLLFMPLDGIVIPEIYGKMFNSINDIKSFPSIFDVTNNIRQNNFAGLMVILVIIWVISLIIGVIKYYVESDIVPKFQKYIRGNIFKKTIKSFENEYEDVKTGEYLSRVIELTRNFSEVIHSGLTRIFPDFIISFLICLYVFYKNKVIGVIILITFLLVVIILYFSSYVLIDMITEKESFFNQYLSNNIQDSMDNLMNIYINNEVDSQIEKNNKNEEKHSEMINKIMITETIVYYVCTFIIVIGYIVALISIYNLLSTSTITIKDAIVFVLILGKFQKYYTYVASMIIHNIIYKLGIINASREFLEKIFKEENDKKKSNFINKGSITLEDVSFKYDKDNDEYLFDKINIKIKGGEKVALVGQSGSGKSTLLKLILNLYQLENGNIYIDDVNIKEADNGYLRKKVNYINQKTDLFDETVLYNMNYGNNIDEEIIIKILKKYKLDEVFSELNDGVNSECGIHGNNLSGGMQRVVMLVRGILKPSQIVLIDEPLSALDPDTRVKVIKMIVEECKNKTLVIVTHDEEILPYMDEVVNIKDIQ